MKFFETYGKYKAIFSQLKAKIIKYFFKKQKLLFVSDDLLKNATKIHTRKINN